jgi:hypothetical protein
MWICVSHVSVSLLVALGRRCHRWQDALPGHQCHHHCLRTPDDQRNKGVGAGMSGPVRWQLAVQEDVSP